MTQLQLVPTSGHDCLPEVEQTITVFDYPVCTADPIPIASAESYKSLEGQTLSLPELYFSLMREHSSSREGEDCENHITGSKNYQNYLDENWPTMSLESLDDHADVAEATIENIQAKMALIMAQKNLGAPYNPNLSSPELDQIEQELGDELCQFSLADAKALLNIAGLIAGVPEYNADIGQRGCISIVWLLDGKRYSWLVMKSDNSWPLVRVLVTCRDFRTDDPIVTKMYYNYKSLLEDLVGKIDRC